MKFNIIFLVLFLAVNFSAFSIPCEDYCNQEYGRSEYYLDESQRQRDIRSCIRRCNAGLPQYLW